MPTARLKSVYLSAIHQLVYVSRITTGRTENACHKETALLQSMDKLPNPAMSTNLSLHNRLKHHQARAVMLMNLSHPHYITRK
ncbi:hypothetical protein ANCCAN_26901 [Ancylostoma caninum]|uniref:Uncharacterized protein n=1 Tax=Ancylostoma caninum TaxID=29170 RepID=A0A368F5F2_ANCCA|nr:hypothetical protein ANCCAN_26901 [Ancylostoma caninum]